MASYVIAGASRGLGREWIRQLASNKSNTAIALVRSPESSSALQELASQHSNVHIVKADVTDPKSLESAAAEVSTITGGKLDVLVYNPAIIDYGHYTPSQLPQDDAELRNVFKNSIDIQIYGAIWTTNAFLPLIEQGTEKKIVHISTGMSDTDFIRTTGIPVVVPYSVGKAALNVLVAKYATELAPKGIKVLALSPGWVDTYEGPRECSLVHDLCLPLTNLSAVPVPDAYAAMQASLLEPFRKVDPSLTGSIDPEESVRSQLDVIGRLDEKLSGSLVGHHGDKNWF